ncbi:ABC transporter ATP-binding protein [Streptomyces sp. R41]|uniref:ABC transporter ATP-binding protein n=1 Tax=Streptomyces sp. R41 TaxID=3238632 RepID=A0AB39RWS8_9ACTN
MPTPMRPSPSAAAHGHVTPVNGLRVQARRVSRQVRGAGRVLQEVSLDVDPGRLTVIAGSSGAGKTILLQTLAGLRRPAEGEVLHDGAQPGPPGPEFGFVPQEDIIHRELPLHRTLVYAAGLRMPPGPPAESVAASVDRVLQTLGLSHRGATPVRALSGGERKRASIAVELLTRPRVLFLDEPTSGLDPVTGAALLRTLRALAEDGTTVVLTTHVLADLLRCDQVVFLSPGGEVAFAGEPDALCGAFGVGTVEEVYEAVAEGVRVPQAPPQEVCRPEPSSTPLPRLRVGAVRQWALLTRRVRPCWCTTGSRSRSWPVRR